jgi:hypothetical protein
MKKEYDKPFHYRLVVRVRHIEAGFIDVSPYRDYLCILPRGKRLYYKDFSYLLMDALAKLAGAK